MGTEPAKELLKKWKLRNLTVEMATGHTLQHLVMLHETDKQANIQYLQIISALGETETSLRSLRHDVDALIAHTSMPLTQTRGRPKKYANLTSKGDDSPMSMTIIPAKKLLNDWEQEQLTVEVAVGHILQHLESLHKIDKQATIQRQQIISQLSEIQATLRSLRHDVDALIAHTKMPPAKPKRGRPRKDEK